MPDPSSSLPAPPGPRASPFTHHPLPVTPAAGRTGLLIAGAGLPGSGKSSVFRSLAELTGWRVFLEPEEPEWPAAVLEQSRLGSFTALTWFRAMRVPHLHLAAALRDAGDVALIDSYYDKILGYYIRDPQMHWLIKPSDAYYEVFARLTEIDRDTLPNADVVVFFRVNAETWEHLVRSRSRAADQHTVLPQAFPIQDLIQQAAETHCRRTGARLLVFDPPVESPENAAGRLLTLLKDRGVTKPATAGEIAGSGV